MDYCMICKKSLSVPHPVFNKQKCKCNHAKRGKPISRVDEAKNQEKAKLARQAVKGTRRTPTVYAGCTIQGIHFD